MTGPRGGFYSTQDADSEGEEGKFFVWTPEEIDDVIDDDKSAAIFGAYYGVSPRATSRAANILYVDMTSVRTAWPSALGGGESDEVEQMLAINRQRLFAVPRSRASRRRTARRSSPSGTA